MNLNRDISNKTAALVIIPVLLVFGLILVNKVAIQDWLHFRGYSPDAEIELLAEEAGMSEEGERLFFRASPELADSQTVSDICIGFDTLGCLVTGPKIYILDYEQDNRAEYNQAVVTGAHEMLHMAYFRLSEDDKTEVNGYVDQALSKLSDTRIFSLLESSESDEEYYDEAYAMLGTEVERLPLQLEAHYQDYFDDRAAVIKAFELSKSLLL